MMITFNSAGIKPVACSKMLCSHQFDEMGFGASMDMIYTFPTVADLLISMAAAAAANTNLKHRQRFFACPNPPSDFVHSLALQPDNPIEIDWPLLTEVPATFLPSPCCYAVACRWSHACYYIASKCSNRDQTGIMTAHSGRVRKHLLWQCTTDRL